MLWGKGAEEGGGAGTDRKRKMRRPSKATWDYLASSSTDGENGYIYVYFLSCVNMHM